MKIIHMIPMLLLLVVSSCEKITAPISNTSDQNVGKILFSFDKTTIPGSVKTISTSISRSGYLSQEKDISVDNDTSATVVFESVAIGVWYIKIEALNENGSIIYFGQTSVTVTENEIATVQVSLTPVSSGVGSIHININWNPNISTYYPKFIGGVLKEMAMSVIESDDGGSIIGGISYSVGSGGDGWLVKTNQRGDILWSKNYGSTGEDRINCIISDNGGYLFVGYKHGTGEDSWIVRLDSVGNILWEKNYGIIGDDAFLRLKKLSDGNYLTCGYSSDGTYFDGRIVKLSSSGDLLWDKRYGGSGGDFLMNFSELSQNSIVVTGYNGSNLLKNYDLWVLRINNEGNLLWQKTYGSNNEERTTGGLVRNSEGNFVVSGYKVSSGIKRGIIFQFNENGDSLWTKEYLGVTGDINALVALDNNSIIAIANGVISGLSQQGILLNVNNTGTLNWMKNFGGQGFDSFIDICKTYDQKLLITGTSFSETTVSEDYWLVKTDVEGNIQ